MTSAEPTDDDQEFFAEHAISRTVREARPYVRWTVDDVQPVRDGYAGLNAHQRAYMTRLAGQADGWLITRHAPPGMALDHVYPEIRPDMKVRTAPPTKHYHGDPALAPPPDVLNPKRVYTPKAMKAHIARDKDTGDHYGVNTDEVHMHEQRAKYCFPPAARKDVPWAHDHSAYTTPSRTPQTAAKKLERLRAHQEHYHAEWDGPGGHEHLRRAKDRTVNLARRLDVHPMAVSMIGKATVVFFVIEGCFKADAVLTAGAAVFSVPSVTLWDCAELAGFVDRYLAGKTVVIVPDADWGANPAVISQARICSAALLRYGVGVVHVAAPPIDPETGEPTAGKGVDDFLAQGGTLDDLMTVDRMPPDPVRVRERMLDCGTRTDGVDRNTDILTALALFAGSKGTVTLPLRTMAKVMGTNPSRVSRAISDLQAMGAVTVDGDLAQRRGYWTRELAWKNVPAVTIAPEFRAEDQPPRRLARVILGDRMAVPRAA